MQRFYVLVGCFPKQGVRNNLTPVITARGQNIPTVRKQDPGAEAYILNHAEKSASVEIFEKQRILQGPLSAVEIRSR